MLSSYKDLLKTKDKDDFRLIKETTDLNGVTHQRFQQYYSGIKVEDAQYLTHGKLGLIETINGDFQRINISSVTPSINEKVALTSALNYVNAKKYKWEDPSMEAFIKKNSSNNNATYYPKGELVITKDFEDQNDNFRLAWKFQISSLDPNNEQLIYVDAIDGKVVRNSPLIFDANITCTAQTRYSGSQNITGDSYSGNYRLRETRNGNNIITLNLQHSTSNYAAAVDFTNSSTNWNSANWTNFSQDQAALDAHWGAEVVMDYWHNVHNRNSIDNNGIRMLSYVHWGTNILNAQWVSGTNSHFMQYGDGTSQPFTALDVCAHEIGHGINEFTANLAGGTQESAALNEGFSDIWAASIEHWGAPNKQMWKMGEEMVSFPFDCVRDMQNPNSSATYEGPHPDTYLGQYWSSTGEPHTNSTVLSHWFYLLSQGGSGTNDNGDSYNVAGIGVDEASKIVYYAESHFLTPSSDYEDTRDAMISASNFLHSQYSAETIAVTKAWYAVGVGSDIDLSQLFPITGPSIICSSGTYLINNVQAGSTVVWSISPTGIFNISPSGNSVIVTKVASGSATLTATIDGNITLSKEIRNEPTVLSVNASLYGPCTSTAWQEWYLDASIDHGTFVSWQVANTSGGAQVNIYSAHYASISKGSASLNFTYQDSCGNLYTVGGPTIYKPCASTTMAAPAPLYLLSPNPAVNSININPNKTSINLPVKDSSTKATPRRSEIIQVNIYDQSGNRKQQRDFNKVRNARMNIGNLPSGIYFVELILNDGSKEKHSLIIKH